MVHQLILSVALFGSLPVLARHDSLQQPDIKPLKISHAEPVYIDLIRDLGARKGEKELNIGWQLNDEGPYREQGGYVEYEFSPLNRLGLEIEVPFSYAYASRELTASDLPHTRVEALKLAAQYTFLVSGRQRLSVAAGAIYGLNFHSFYTMAQSRRSFKGHAVNPFLVVAKRWGQHWHTLLYTGPVLYAGFDDPGRSVTGQLNFSVHYQVPGQGHLLGLELNQELRSQHPEIVLRPQVRLRLGRGLALGLATGIPCQVSDKGLSFFTRLVYEFSAS